MSTSPILEALAPQPSSPLQINSGSCDPTSESSFYQVLQQLSSASTDFKTEATTSNAPSNVTHGFSDNTVPSNDKVIAGRTHSALASNTTQQDTMNAAREPCASKEPPGTPNNFSGSKAKKEKTFSKVVCADAKQDLTAQDATSFALVSVFSVQIPAQTNSLQITPATGDSGASAQQGSAPQISTTSLELSLSSSGASINTNGTPILREAAALTSEHASATAPATESETARSFSVSPLPTLTSLINTDDGDSGYKLPASSEDSKNKVSESTAGKDRQNDSVTSLASVACAKVSSAAESKDQPQLESSSETTIAFDPSSETGKNTGSSSASTQYVSIPAQPVTQPASLREDSADNHSPAPVTTDSSAKKTAFLTNDSSQEKTRGSRTAVCASAPASGASRPLASQVSTAATASVDAPAAASALILQHTQEIARATSRSEPSFQPNQIPDPPRIVDSGHLTVNRNNAELKVSVQIPELGKVEVRAIATHHTTTAHLTASPHSALQLLNSDRTGLEQTLRAHDVILGSLDTQSQGQSAGHQRQQSFQSQTPFTSDSTPVTTAATVPVALDSAIGNSADDSGINVRI